MTAFQNLIASQVWFHHMPATPESRDEEKGLVKIPGHVSNKQTKNQIKKQQQQAYTKKPNIKSFTVNLYKIDIMLIPLKNKIPFLSPMSFIFES